ncbi:Nn.00g017440.m01.CDS01 [Neocucurbitaria sp. VM-36]
MSSVVSSAQATASSSSCSTADFTQFPTSDVACAVGSVNGIPSNTSDVLSSCCKSAPVEQFNGDCGYYCLSVEQSVADLQACFMDGGVSPSSIFCSGNNTATATGKPSASSGSTTAPSGSAQSTGAAPVVFAPQSVSKTGLGMLCMIIVSAFAGAML